jgi:hypothetical protein
MGMHPKKGLLYRWRIYVEAQKTLTEDDKGLLMNFSKIYQEHQGKNFAARCTARN